MIKQKTINGNLEENNKINQLISNLQIRNRIEEEPSSFNSCGV